MQKRNFILLIIFLVIVAIIFFVVMYFTRPEGEPREDGGGTNFFSDLNPFGRKDTGPDGEGPTDISNYEPEPGEEDPELRLEKVSSMPVAGYGIFMRERYIEVPPAAPAPTLDLSGNPAPAASTPTPPSTEIVPMVRYVARANGNIYQTFTDNIDERKFSNTIIPRVYEAQFGNKGNSVIMRYLKPDEKTIETFLGVLPEEVLGGDSDGENNVKGTFLPENTIDVSISPDASKVFYIFITSDNAVGTIYEFVSGKKTQVFDSAFTEWLSSWPINSSITMTTKPASGIPGYMYSINPDRKDFSRVLGNISGLTTLPSPDGEMVLYGDSNLALNIYHIDPRATDSMSVRTLPEKCVWGESSEVIYCAVPKSIPPLVFPDSWYQGEASFDDAIWKIDTLSGSAEIIADPLAFPGGEAIDAIKLSIDEAGNNLFFVNKKDSYLWKLSLE